MSSNQANQANPSHPEGIALSPETLENLRAQLAALEKSRSGTYKAIVNGFVILVITGPFWITGLILAGKFGLLAFLKPVFTPVGSVLSSLLSQRRGGRLIGALIALIVITPFELLRSRINKRYHAVVVPTVFEKLAIPYDHPGPFTRKYLKGVFYKDVSHVENPITAYGHVAGTPFQAHIIKAIYLKSEYGSTQQTPVPLFEGFCIQLTLPQPVSASLLLTFQSTKLKTEKWHPIPLPAESEDQFSAYTQHPNEIQSLLSPAFLADLATCNGSYNDLPPMELVLIGQTLTLFIPTKLADHLPKVHISMNLTSLTPIHKMLSGWHVMLTNLNLLHTYHPELFTASSNPVTKTR